MKVYNEYKEIELKDIKGRKVNLNNRREVEKLNRYMNEIKKEGIKNPFEIIEDENRYKNLGFGEKLLAAKLLNYDRVPCLIRDREKEIILRKFYKYLGLEDENSETEFKCKRLNPYTRNYYKLNIL